MYFNKDEADLEVFGRRRWKMFHSIHLKPLFLVFSGPADPSRMTMDDPSDWTAGGLDSDWRILKMSPLNNNTDN